MGVNTPKNIPPRIIPGVKSAQNVETKDLRISLILDFFSIGVLYLSANKYINTIEKEIHSSPNRTREAMNYALIAIGTYKLDKEAISAAIKIGHVEIDHGKTWCKTTDAISYIKKARARLKKN